MIRTLRNIFLGAMLAPAAIAQPARGFDDSASNLMAVLRESGGTNKPDESLVPIGKGKVTLADGKVVEVNFAWFDYIGDMHVRFVFDTPTTLLNASVDDLKRLSLTPEAALELAVKNIRRVYGEPHSEPWNDFTQVRGKSSDLSSSYFLDKAFWTKLLAQHPEGIVALVAKRGGLLYAPASDTKAVNGMKRDVAYLYQSSERQRISSALYLFKDGRWTVFQAPAHGQK